MFASYNTPLPAIVNPVLPDQPSLERGRAAMVVSCPGWADSREFDELVERLPRLRDEELWAAVDEGWRTLPACDAALPDTAYDSVTARLPMLRAVKDANELARLEAAGAAADATYEQILGVRFSGRKETDVAADLADHVVVSSDNPRTESPEAIVQQILAGIPESAHADVQVDRARAIMQTIWAASPEDVVLLAGKGHETYQDIGGEKLPFDDREWARLAMLLPQVKGVSTDTRRIGSGELFVALVGDKQPQQALDDAARAWDAITDRLGRASQKAFWAKQAEAMKRLGIVFRPELAAG